MRAGKHVFLIALVLSALGIACNKAGSAETLPMPDAGAALTPSPDVFKSVTQVTHDFRGSSYPIAQTKGTTTTLHSFQATGDSGLARVDALLVYKTHVETRNPRGNRRPPKTDERCPSTCGSLSKENSCKYGVDLVSMTWVQTYNDGSAFTGALPTDPDDAARREKYFKNSFVCTNGGEFYIHVNGIIVDGKGPRFENVNAGEWNVTATTSTYLTEGKFTATLKY